MRLGLVELPGRETLKAMVTVRGSFLADGYSCRTQIADLSNAQGVSLPELLAWGWVSNPAANTRRGAGASGLGSEDRDLCLEQDPLCL